MLSSKQQNCSHAPSQFRKYLRTSLNVTFLALTFSPSLFADSHQYEATKTLSPLEEEILWLKEETYVTTATKTREDIKKSGSTVSIITEQELQSMGARNLMDALKRIPGLGVTTSSIGLPVIEVRGVKSDFSGKVLLLINGHAINTNLANGGATTAHNNFLIDGIKRVEIVRGPGSALYGADAFVAVINIITKKPEDINGTQVALGLGDNETRKVNIQTGQQQHEIKSAFNATFFETDGYQEHVESDFFGNSGKTSDWNKQFNLGFNLSYSNFALQGQYLKRNSGPYIGFGNALNDESKQDYSDYFFDLNYTRDVSKNIQFNQNIYYNKFIAKNIWEVFPENYPTPSHTEGVLAASPVSAESFGTELKFEAIIKDHKFVFGLMAEHQSVFDIGFEANFNPTTGAPLPGGFQDIYEQWPWLENQRRDVQAAFFQDIWDINQRLRLIIGARYDHYSDVGSSFNPRSSLSWAFSETDSVIVTYGSAFRAPNFSELYNKNNPSALGNPDLEPEEIKTYEVSLNSALNKRTNFRGTFFKNKISDLIYVKDTISNNVGNLEVNGVELEFGTRFRNGSSADFNYTYQYAVNEETNQRIESIPMHKTNASYNYRYSQFLSAYFGANYLGKTKREAADTRSENSEHVTLDVALSLKSTDKKTDINVSIYNLFNEKYFDAAAQGTVNSDFPKPGRSFMIEVSQKL